MSRTVYGNVKNADGTVPAGPVVWDLQELIVSEDGIVLPGTYEADLDVAGDFSITLPTPMSGSALYHYTYPNGLAYAVELETGPSVDIATIQTIEEADVAQDALQDLMDQAKKLRITAVATTYQVLATDEYLRFGGTTYAALFPAATRSGRVIAGKNLASGNITLTPNGSDTIDGYASIALTPLGGFVMIDAAVGRWDIHGV
jgi:hypothetical protein